MAGGSGGWWWQWRMVVVRVHVLVHADPVRVRAVRAPLLPTLHSTA
jgi:hypothetical protein